MELEQKLSEKEDEKKAAQEQLDSVNDTLQEKETEFASIQLELERLTLEVQNLTKENGELSMQFADMKMAADRIRYESTEQALLIDTLTSENNTARTELQLLQDQIKLMEEEKALQEKDKDEEATAPAHQEKSNPVKRYSREWALKEEQLKKDLEEGFLSSADDVTETAADASAPPEVHARITELEQAIKEKDEILEKHTNTHGVLTTQNSQLQLEHGDLRAQLQARDAEIQQLKAALNQQDTKARQREQQDEYRRAQDTKWQNQKQEGGDEQTGEQPAVEQQIDEPVEQSAPSGPSVLELKLAEQSKAHSKILVDYEYKVSMQGSEIERLLTENNILKAQLSTPSLGAELLFDSEQEKFKVKTIISVLVLFQIGLTLNLSNSRILTRTSKANWTTWNMPQRPMRMLVKLSSRMKLRDSRTRLR